VSGGWVVQQNACSAHLAIEYWLDIDLTSEIKFFRGRYRAFIPLLQDLSKARRVDLDKLLGWEVSIEGGGVRILN